MRNSSDVAETLCERVAIFCFSDTDLFSARCKKKREGRSPLSINTAAFGRVLVMLFAGLALCYGEVSNFTWLAYIMPGVSWLSTTGFFGLALKHLYELFFFKIWRYGRVAEKSVSIFKRQGR
jgi:hypothetical protein